MLIVAITAVTSILALYLAHRIGRLLATSLAMIAIAATTFVLALVAVERDFRDADGFMDCWPNCTLFQEVVGVTVFAAPIVFIAALVALILGGSLAAVTRE